MNRRTFLQSSVAAGVSTALVHSLAAAAAKSGRAPTLLLRSGWQTINIGDIAHTPGVLTLLEKHLPEVKVRFWPRDAGNGVEAMLRKRFPRVEMVTDEPAVVRAFAECDFLLHGSGPTLVARRDVERWLKETGKPYGVYGITFPGVYEMPPENLRANPLDLELLTKAKFVYFRDSGSLAFARKAGVTCPVMEFGPDGAFATDVRDDQAALQFMQASGLEEGKFLCVIPRQRYSPYWKERGTKSAKNGPKEARNEAMKEHDHRPLREAIVAVVQQTPLKVLICPEDTTQIAFGREVLYDPLPEVVKKKVAFRDRYWLTDEALSVYVRSAGMFGLEMHSPIMCIGNGIPAMVGWFDEQTSKGLMWRDIGLGDWLFDFDRPEDVARILPTVLAMARDPAAAKARAEKARAVVNQHQQTTMAYLRRCLFV